MTRVTQKPRPTRKTEVNHNSPGLSGGPQTKIISSNKSGWEMSAREALLVDFVVSEIQVKNDDNPNHIVIGKA